MTPAQPQPERGNSTFIGATAIALVVNFPEAEDQLASIKSQATSIVSVVAMVFAAAVLVGVLSGTGMVTAIVAAVPPELGPWFAVITGVLSEVVVASEAAGGAALRLPDGEFVDLPAAQRARRLLEA